MIEIVFAFGAVSCFFMMRIVFFNQDLKRPPNGLKDFFRYRMRFVSTVLSILLSSIFFLVGQGASGGVVDFKVVFLFFIFLLPVFYLVYLFLMDLKKSDC